MRIDLHTHSTASDGTDSPAELMRVAARAGLDVVALTDHDTTAGWPAAERVRPDGLRLVRGAELSCLCPDGRGGRISIHLLAYLFDPEHPAVTAEQARLRDERRGRLRRIAGKLADAGYPVDPDAFMARLPPDLPAGRPHLARALVAEGVVATVDEAFGTLLHNNSPYYLPRADTPVETALEMIAAAGGVCVFAHPLARLRGRVVEPAVIADLAARGLAGVEVDHPDHDAADRGLLRGLAGELDLVVTGSSDYHGTNKTIPIGAERTDPEMFERLVAAARAVEVLG